MTNPDWKAKLQNAVLEEFQNGTEQGEFAQANASSVVDTIKGCLPDSSTIDPDFGARMSSNISSVHIPAFVTASLTGQRAYKNAYDLGKYRIGGSASNGSLKTREIVAITLLGAAHIVAETEPDSLLGNSGVLGGPRQNTSAGPVDLRVLWLRSIAGAAYAWFVEQMPQLIFPQKLEEVIQQTAELSYNDSSTPLTV
jgi:hypothetical protein